MRTSTLCWTCSTLRDQVAVAAMQAILGHNAQPYSYVGGTNGTLPEVWRDRLAEVAYDIADGMLAERTRRDAQKPS